MKDGITWPALDARAAKLAAADRILAQPEEVPSPDVADVAREYVAARLAMSENKQDQLAMILRVDAAWAALVDAVDPQ